MAKYNVTIELSWKEEKALDKAVASGLYGRTVAEAIERIIARHIETYFGIGIKAQTEELEHG